MNQPPLDRLVATCRLDEMVRDIRFRLPEAAWVGEIESPVNPPIRTPGAHPHGRVTVEEWSGS